MNKLSSITYELIKHELNYALLRENAIALKSFFEELANNSTEADLDIEHISTENGLAVSPFSAAFCIMDIMRTRKFLRAVKSAIEDTFKKSPNKPVTILYAGTGPFATLVTPLTSLFSPQQLQLILLEINEISFRSLKTLYQNLGIEKYIAEIVLTDATKYVVPAKYEVDILLSETMRPGLVKEPQISIISHLVTQCSADVIVIPEQINVLLSIYGKKEKLQRTLHSIGPLIKFEKQYAIKLFEAGFNEKLFKEGIVFSVNTQPNTCLTQLGLTTTIVVYKDEVLELDESSLTIPYFLKNISEFEFPLQLLVHYEIGIETGFKLLVINENVKV